VKGLVLLAALLPLPAHADLYRWIDPQTGSAKFSSTPPPWYGDPEKERGAPAVEVVPYRARGGAAAPETKPAVGVAALEVRWSELLRYFASLPPGTDFSAIRAALSEGVRALDEATGWIVATYSSDVKAASAGAVPFLELFGIVAGGWQMARAALAAQAKLSAGDDSNGSFYKAKISTARFYADHVLSQAPGLRHAVVGGAAGVLALDEGQF